jgi:hypothetical protein
MHYQPLDRLHPVRINAIGQDGAFSHHAKYESRQDARQG